MKRHTLPDQTCPRCGCKIDRSVCPANNDPCAPGDISLCILCGDVAQFDEALRLRSLTDDEIFALPPDVIQTIFRYEQERQLMLRREGINPRPSAQSRHG